MTVYLFLFAETISDVLCHYTEKGTGKTFMGELIARIILSNSRAKILCVCYTNHALDQFLEGLVDNGIHGIARLGISTVIYFSHFIFMKLCLTAHTRQPHIHRR